MLHWKEQLICKKSTNCCCIGKKSGSLQSCSLCTLCGSTTFGRNLVTETFDSCDIWLTKCPETKVCFWLKYYLFVFVVFLFVLKVQCIDQHQLANHFNVTKNFKFNRCNNHFGRLKQQSNVFWPQSLVGQLL